MKRVLTLTVSCLIAIATLAQSPEKMSYQAVIRNSSNQLVVNSTIGMRISILQSSISGSSVYVETQKPKSNTNGLVTIEIGDGSVVSGTFASIDWSKGPYFIKTETDPTGGTNYTISGTSQLLSVPFALYAKTAGNGFSGNYNDLINKPNIPTNVSQLNNDKGFLSKFTEKDSSVTNEIQSLSLRNDTLFLSKNGGFTVLSKNFSSSNGASSHQSLFFESTAVLSANDSIFYKYSSGCSPTTNYKDYSFLIPIDGQIRNLIATPTQFSVQSGTTVTVSIFINGKPTSLSVSFTNADGFNTKSNFINSIAVKQGDFIAIQYKANGSANPGNFQAIVELAPNTSKNEFTHYIGELYGGGIVVSVWKDTSGEHGLIASLKDLSAGAPWSNVSTNLVGSSAQNFADGRENISGILGQSGHTQSAAKLCDDYSIGVYKDWYLPSIWEMSLLFNAAFFVNNILGSNDGFQNTNYWSSTEFRDDLAYAYSFQSNFTNAPQKNNTAVRVRAVRRY